MFCDDNTTILSLGVKVFFVTLLIHRISLLSRPIGWDCLDMESCQSVYSNCSKDSINIISHRDLRHSTTFLMYNRAHRKVNHYLTISFLVKTGATLSHDHHKINK